MQPICSAKLFLAFKAKVIAFFFLSMGFMHIYDNFPLSSQIPSFSAEPIITNQNSQIA